ncbi:hypothetical protein SDJN03_29907, partial [Cucurbita argyrosperma subsp. sororia]
MAQSPSKMADPSSVNCFCKFPVLPWKNLCSQTHLLLLLFYHSPLIYSFFETANSGWLLTFRRPTLVIDFINIGGFLKKHAITAQSSIIDPGNSSFPFSNC